MNRLPEKFDTFVETSVLSPIPNLGQVGCGSGSVKRQCAMIHDMLCQTRRAFE